jgi:hypothetical protein
MADTVVARIVSGRREAVLRLPGNQHAYRARLQRLADYLASLSDQEFREVGQALLDALGPAQGGGPTS